jgi:hypothetical protein
MNDPYAKIAAAAVKLEPGQRVQVFDPNIGGTIIQQLVFFVLENDFDEWRERHQKLIGVDFVKNRAYELKARHKVAVGHLQRINFYCHCSRKKKPAPSNVNAAVQGEPSKKRRKVQAVSIKQDCQAKLSCVLQERLIPNGSPVRVWHIRYNFQHSHPLAKDDRVGTQRLSAAAKHRIDLFLQSGSPVRDVLYRMRARATKIAQLGKNKIFRDDIITYEDVYNAFYKKMVQETQKDKNHEVSAEKWMEELKGEGYFTCYQNGTYYGFASPWQLQQLRDNGKSFCFDGTHKVCGYEQSIFLSYCCACNTGNRLTIFLRPIDGTLNYSL